MARLPIMGDPRSTWRTGSSVRAVTAGQQASAASNHIYRQVSLQAAKLSTVLQTAHHAVSLGWSLLSRAATTLLAHAATNIMRTCRLSLRLPERFLLGLAGPFCSCLGMVATTSASSGRTCHRWTQLRRGT